MLFPNENAAMFFVRRQTKNGRAKYKKIGALLKWETDAQTDFGHVSIFEQAAVRNSSIQLNVLDKSYGCLSKNPSALFLLQIGCCSSSPQYWCLFLYRCFVSVQLKNTACFQDIYILFRELVHFSCKEARNNIWKKKSAHGLSHPPNVMYWLLGTNIQIEDLNGRTTHAFGKKNLLQKLSNHIHGSWFKYHAFPSFRSFNFSKNMENSWANEVNNKYTKWLNANKSARL